MLKNWNAKCWLYLGAILVVFAGLYPPWIEVHEVGSRRTEDPSVYGWLFLPPKPPGKVRSKEWAGKYLRDMKSTGVMQDPAIMLSVMNNYGDMLGRGSEYHMKVDVTRLAVEWFVILVSSVALYSATRKANKSTSA